MAIPVHVVNAFTRDGHPFSGNAAAVCLLRYDNEICDKDKQRIASQMNISQTAFVADAWSEDSVTEAHKYTLRWFAPMGEVSLCGHATLATASTVFELVVKDNHTNRIRFETRRSGTLEAVIDRNRQIITIEMPYFGIKSLDPTKNCWIEELATNILGSKLEVNLIDDIQYCDKLSYLLIRLKETKQELISLLSPNFTQLLVVETKMPIRVRLVMVTQKADSTKGVHFYSRVFAPWYGINEDPVCGSAHVLMTPYWQRYYQRIGVYDKELVARQLSTRSGTVICRADADKVYLSGKTRPFLIGYIEAQPISD